MADWIPGISQLKSGFQLIRGDGKDAAKTQENSVRQRPIVSQVIPTVQLITGDEEGALETQKQCFGTLSPEADALPVVGHVKGLIHYAVGDNEGDHRAIKSSTRTCGAGAAEFICGGPVGAVALGIGAEAGIYTAATYTPRGYVAKVSNVIDNPTAGGYFGMALMPVGGAIMEMTDGAIIKSVHNSFQLQQASELYNRADGTLKAAKANAQSMTSAQYMQQTNMAADQFRKAQNIEANVDGPHPAAFINIPTKPGQSALVAAARQASSTVAPIVVPESRIGVTGEPTRRVYGKWQTRQDGSSTKFQSISLTNFQFVLIDLSTRLNKLALAMLECLRSLAEDSIIIMDNDSFVDFNKLPNKITLLFVSSEFAAKMKDKPLQTEAIFILEDDKNKTDYRTQFDSGEDLIFQLADEIYRSYKKEVKECSESGDFATAKIKEELANDIHGELKKVYKSVSTNNDIITEPINTETTLVWLESNSHDTETKNLENIFRDAVSSVLVFDNEFHCLNYLREHKSVGAVFLIINTIYGDSIVADCQQLPNVKVVYRYGKSSAEKQAVIGKYNDLCLRLTRDLIAYYHTLGSNCSTSRDAKPAEVIYMRIRELYYIFNEL